ncbi:murein tripeptide amidase MpaA, partial [Klebsiella pneumoniae]
DIGLPCITAEFPPVSADEATERYLPAMTDLLRWQA